LHYISQFVKDKSSKKSNCVLSETNEFKITQIVDNAQMVQLTLIENVTTEPVSQKQLIIENVSKKLDSETKEQVMPLLEAILQAQPTINIKTYQQTQITITMPKSRYNNMGRPQVGNIIEVDLKKI
jgi:phage-related protein